MKNIIGIFDSGIGGLTVLSDLINKYPEQDFTYLADNLNLPYGTKTKEELERIVDKNIRFLISQGVKTIVIACNTASTVHLQDYDIPIFKIIHPTARIANSNFKKVAILATDFTIESKTYEKYLRIDSVGVKCSDFVDMVETGNFGNDNSLYIIRKKLGFLENQVDAVILGCTHFSLLKNDIQKVLPNVTIIDSSLSMASEIKSLINNDNKKGNIRIIQTGKEELNISWFRHDYEKIII